MSIVLNRIPGKIFRESQKARVHVSVCTTIYKSFTMEEKREVTMKLTKEQFQAFEAFANFNDWDLEITENGWNNDNTLDADDSENQHVVSASVHTHIPLDVLSGDSVIRKM